MKYLTTNGVSLFVMFFLMTHATLAAADEQVTMLAASSAVQDLTKTIADAKKKTNVPIVFPSIVPAPAAGVKYYASSDFSAVSNGISYIINIDASKDCNGAHYCNIGSLRAEQGANPQVYYDRNNKEITVTFSLPHNIKGFYTPGHAMGDYFSPNIQWRDKNILYTLNWNANLGSSEQGTLTKMVSSAIN